MNVELINITNTETEVQNFKISTETFTGNMQGMKLET